SIISIGGAGRRALPSPNISPRPQASSCSRSSEEGRVMGLLFTSGRRAEKDRHFYHNGGACIDGGQGPGVRGGGRSGAGGQTKNRAAATRRRVTGHDRATRSSDGGPSHGSSGDGLHAVGVVFAVGGRV